MLVLGRDTGDNDVQSERGDRTRTDSRGIAGEGVEVAQIQIGGIGEVDTRHGHNLVHADVLVVVRGRAPVKDGACELGVRDGGGQLQHIICDQVGAVVHAVCRHSEGQVCLVDVPGEAGTCLGQQTIVVTVDSIQTGKGQRDRLVLTHIGVREGRGVGRCNVVTTHGGGSDLHKLRIGHWIDQNLPIQTLDLCITGTVKDLALANGIGHDDASLRDLGREIVLLHHVVVAGPTTELQVRGDNTFGDDIALPVESHVLIGSTILQRKVARSAGSRDAVTDVVVVVAQAACLVSGTASEYNTIGAKFGGSSGIVDLVHGQQSAHIQRCLTNHTHITLYRTGSQLVTVGYRAVVEDGRDPQTRDTHVLEVQVGQQDAVLVGIGVLVLIGARGKAREGDIDSVVGVLANLHVGQVVVFMHQGGRQLGVIGLVHGSGENRSHHRYYLVDKAVLPCQVRNACNAGSCRAVVLEVGCQTIGRIQQRIGGLHQPAPGVRAQGVGASLVDEVAIRHQHDIAVARHRHIARQGDVTGEGGDANVAAIAVNASQSHGDAIAVHQRQAAGADRAGNRVEVVGSVGKGHASGVDHQGLAGDRTGGIDAAAGAAQSGRGLTQADVAVEGLAARGVDAAAIDLGQTCDHAQALQRIGAADCTREAHCGGASVDRQRVFRTTAAITVYRAREGHGVVGRAQADRSGDRHRVFRAVAIALRATGGHIGRQRRVATDRQCGHTRHVATDRGIARHIQRVAAPGDTTVKADGGTRQRAITTGEGHLARVGLATRGVHIGTQVTGARD